MKLENRTWIRYYKEGRFSKSITFKKAEAEMLRTKTFLNNNGITKGDVVIVKTPNSINAVILYMTLLKNEIVYIPVSPMILKNKLDFIIRDSGAKAIIENDKIIHLDQKRRKVLQGISTIIYTSGTTGDPKGVCLSYRNWKNNSRALRKHHQFNDKTVLLTPLPLFHVNAHGLAMITSYICKSRLILLDKYDENILKIINKEHVTVASFVPVILDKLLEKNSKFHFNKKFKYFITAAAPLKGSLLRRIQENWKTYVVQGYGLSESTNFSCSLPNNLSITEYSKVMFPHPSIGIELPGVKIKFKNSKNNEGELQVKSNSNSIKYLGKSLRKIPWINTGDIGYAKKINGKKYFYLTGRKKELINRGGEKLSPIELEEELINNGLKGEFAIISISDEKFGEDVGLVSTRRINNKILKNIPYYRRPKKIIMLKALPYTASGKIQRKNLSELINKNGI